MRGLGVFRILDFLECGATDDRSHLFKAGFIRRPSDVLTQLRGHRIQFIQGVTLSHKTAWIESLGAGGMPSCGSAEGTSIGFVAHRPRDKCRQDPPETSLLLIGPAAAVGIFAIADISPRIALNNFPGLQKARLRVFQ